MIKTSKKTKKTKDKKSKKIKQTKDQKVKYYKVKTYKKTNLLNDLYTFKSNTDYRIIKYKLLNKKKNILDKKNNKQSNIDSTNQLKLLKKYKSYHYNELDYIQNKSKCIYLNRLDLNIYLNKYKNKKKIENEKNIIKKISEGFTRGVAQYVLINFKLPHKTSNAYMKLWELYASVPQLLPNKKQLNVFHLAEAPGQWINCTRHYIETKRYKVGHYNWVANSLNPTHPTNVAKYGKNIFADDYGFLKKYPQKWLYGADDTGDITKSKNVKWFREYMSNFKEKSRGEGLHLITGDAGLQLGIGGENNVKLVELQKLEFAQMCMVAACANKGTNCVIKHFLHYLNAYPNTFEASGYMISFLYIYFLMFEEIRLIKPHTSNSNSREFYLVGLRFIGIDDKIFQKLIKNLDNFEENQCFFKKNDIPIDFSNQVISFMTSIFKININSIELQSILMNCIINPISKLDKEDKEMCYTYTNYNFIKKIQTKRYKEWIKTYRFE